MPGAASAGVEGASTAGHFNGLTIRMSREMPGRDLLLKEILVGMRDLGFEIDLMDEALAGMLGLNRTDIRCLDRLGRMGPAPAGRLAECLGLTPGATTTVIDRLERAGYACRRHHEKDRRQVLVEVTGRAAAELPPLHADLVAEARRILQAYDDDQLALILGFVTRMREVIVAHGSRLRAGAPRARDHGVSGEGPG